MYFISRVTNTTVNVTDTKDGISEKYTIKRLARLCKANPNLVIVGFTDTGYKPTVVHTGKSIKQNNFMQNPDPLQPKHKESISVTAVSALEDSRLMLGDILKKYDDAYFYELARRNSFARDYKATSKSLAERYGLGSPAYSEYLLKYMVEKLIPSNVEEAISSMSKVSSTGSLTRVDTRDVRNVLSALLNNLCVAVCISAKGGVTSFCGSAGTEFIKSYYQGYDLYACDLYDIIKRYSDDNFMLQNIEQREKKEYTPDPRSLKLLSGALRVRQEGKKVVKLNHSSTTYSVNLDRLLALYIIDTPLPVGATISTALDKGIDIGYEPEVFKYISSNFDSLDESFIKTFVSKRATPNFIQADILIKQFNEKLGYLQYMHKSGRAFTKANIIELTKELSNV